MQVPRTDKRAFRSFLSQLNYRYWDENPANVRPTDAVPRDQTACKSLERELCQQSICVLRSLQQRSGWILQFAAGNYGKMPAVKWN